MNSGSCRKWHHDENRHLPCVPFNTLSYLAIQGNRQGPLFVQNGGTFIVISDLYNAYQLSILGPVMPWLAFPSASFAGPCSCPWGRGKTGSSWLPLNVVFKIAFTHIYVRLVDFTTKSHLQSLNLQQSQYILKYPLKKQLSNVCKKSHTNEAWWILIWWCSIHKAHSYKQAWDVWQ